MPRDFSAYLEDILEAIAKLEEYTRGLSFEQFRADAKTIDAVIRNLEVIGEAAKQVPETVRSAHSDVEWRRLAGLRDILIHAYFGIDLDIVWNIVQTKLPHLRRQVQAILRC